MRLSIAALLTWTLALAACDGSEPLPPADGGRDATIPEGAVPCTSHSECPPVMVGCDPGMCSIDGYCIWNARGCDAGVPSAADAAAP